MFFNQFFFKDKLINNNSFQKSWTTAVVMNAANMVKIIVKQIEAGLFLLNFV